QTFAADAVSLPAGSETMVDRRTGADRKSRGAVPGWMRGSGRTFCRRGSGVHDDGEFVAPAMKISLRTTRAGVVLAALVLCVGLFALGQDSAQDSSAQPLSPQPLGDVARKARKEHLSADHVAATHVANGEDDGPDSSGVWRLRPCPTTILCYELSVVLPKTLKWERATSEPRPVLIPVAGYEKDPDRAIRVYA